MKSRHPYLIRQDEIIKGQQKIIEKSYGYKNQMWGIHLGTEVLKKLAFLNIDLDVDLYACGKEVQ